MIFRFSTPFRAIGAVFRSFWAKTAGYRVLTTPGEYASRVAECEDCDNLTEDRQCDRCTCFVDAKAMLCAEKCPRGKWPAVWAKSSGRRS